jgi:hypothetical protein
MGLGVFGQDHDRLWRWIGSFYSYLQDWWSLECELGLFSRFIFALLILCAAFPPFIMMVLFSHLLNWT